MDVIFFFFFLCIWCSNFMLKNSVVTSSYRPTKSSVVLWMLSRSPPMALQKSLASNQVFSSDRGPVKNLSPRQDVIKVG